MTKCLFKALKAVDLDKHVGLFRSLGYESAGALAHFRTEDFDKLKFVEQDLLRLISLLDVLKESTRDGKICPHYFTTSTKTTVQQSNIKSTPIYASWNDDTIPQANLRKPTQENNKTKSSMGIPVRSSSISIPLMSEMISQRSSTVLSRPNPTTPIKNTNQRSVSLKPFLNRPAVQHVKVRIFEFLSSISVFRRLNRIIMVYQRLVDHEIHRIERVFIRIQCIFPHHDIPVMRVPMGNQQRSMSMLENDHSYQQNRIFKM